MSRSIEIARPADEVFAYVAHLPNSVEWREGVVEARILDGESMARGASMVERLRMLGRTVVTRSVVTEWDPVGCRMAFRSIGGPIDVTGSYEVEQTKAGCVFTYTLSGTSRGMGRLLDPIYARWGPGWMERSLAAAKARLESPTAGPAMQADRVSSRARSQ